MNEQYQTKGIIIGRKDFCGADKLLTIFTEDLGKIKVKARGVKKVLAKLAGHLEIFNYTDLNLVKGRNFYIVIGAQIIKSFSLIKNDFEKISILYYFSEILDRVLEEDVQHKNIFNFLLSVINRLEQKNVNILLLMIFFELNILSNLGFRPEFLVCVGCRGEIWGHDFYFNVNRGGVLCKSCGDKDLFSDPVSFEAIKLMRVIVNKDYDFLKKINPDQNIVREVKQINSFFLEHILGKELKSKAFLNI